MAYLSVSAFAADFSYMGRDIQKVQNSGADFLHVDVMDGHFVPLIGLSTYWIKSIQENTNVPMDIHLMTYNTASFVLQLLEFNVNSILFHVESECEQETHRLLKMIRDHSISCGLAISPETDLKMLGKYISVLDEILIMGTNPGRAGTFFNSKTFERISEMRMMAQHYNRKIVISVDGGINTMLAKECVRCGADKIIIGRAFFRSKRPTLIAEKIHGYKY